MKELNRQLLLLIALLLVAPGLRANENEPVYPAGLMLNLDFAHAENGLIPNQGLYPLYVPLGTLEVKTLLSEPMLNLLPPKGLSVPHSSLLQPDGNTWQATVRVGCRSIEGNGLIMSQANQEHGYALFLHEGSVYAAVRTAESTVILHQTPTAIVIDPRKKMVIIDLRIEADKAILLLDRAPVATLPLTAPLRGEYMPIRIGNNAELPDFLKTVEGIDATGIDGAISALRIWRQ